ncbi:MAG: PqqD family protein [Clostridiales bacterium]|nr:PqqD family protein [Clostridiales bacterium]
MKIRDDFKLRKVCDSTVVVAVGKASLDLNGMISLNETGELLWKLLEKGAEENDLVSALIKEYNVDEETARQDVKAFVESLEGKKILE